MKFINRLKWHLKELDKTLSNQPSFYSSKRIERMILFVNALVILDLFIIKEYEKLTTAEIISIFTIQMIYAGFQTKQLAKEKKDDEIINNSNNNNIS